MNYEEWNLALSQHFFNEDMAGREVLLYANESLIKRIGGGESAWPDFLAAIQQGPEGSTRTGFCQKALQAKDRWQDRSHSYPPYLAHLVFFVIAAGTDEDFAPHAFYPRLWKLMGQEKEGAPPSFHQMIDLWSDLEHWSREDRHEELGRFLAWPRGNWIHVGMPWSQLILSEDERRALPKIFYHAEFDPTAPPATDVLVRDLVSSGRDLLRRQTIKLLSSTAEDQKVMRNGLAEFVLEELSHWSGEIPEEMRDFESPTTIRVQTGLRICMDIDTFSRSVRAYFRFKATRPFPAGGLQFDEGTDGQVWECTETFQGWSTALEIESTPGTKAKRIDAAKFDWIRGLTIYDKETGWRARLRGTNVRLFFSGRHENLPGWVETHKLQRERDFIIIALRRYAPEISAWGSSSCSSFTPYELKGLPEGWLAFSGKGAFQSCVGIDVLSLSPTARLTLTGGIRTGRGNTYFDYAPPKIMVENYSTLPTIKVNGQIISPSSTEDPVWVLPSNLPLLTPIVIEAEEISPLPKRMIRLQKPDLAPSWDSVPFRDFSGKVSPLLAGTTRAQGATVEGEVTLPPQPPEPHLPTYLASRINFIGRLPGQICEWPQDEIPTTWHPAWAVAKTDREHWKAHFCGLPEHFTKPSIGNRIQDSSRVKNWKQALWNLRILTEQPTIPQVKLLWKEYVEAAENV